MQFISTIETSNIVTQICINPADKWRNDNVIIMSKLRCDVDLT